MDDKGEIISSCDVDENIALQIWTKGMSPRLVIFNKNQNSRKMIRLNWLENLERKLSLKGKKRGESAEYCLSDLLPYCQRILAEYAVYTSFKPRLWKFAGLLEKILHTPAIVSDKGELSLLGEDKRSCLWIADLTDGRKGEGSFRPFFPLTEKEQSVLSKEGIPFTENRRSMEDLFKTGVVRKLANAFPARWRRPLQIMAAGILLGFSFCEEDGADFVDDFWCEDADNSAPLKSGDTRIQKLDRRFVAYVRHFVLLGDLTYRVSMDSDKELLESEYTRKRRIQFPVGLLGDVEYAVTFFEHADGTTALGCKPRSATARHKGELIYTFPTALYEKALADDALGGAADEYFSVAQLTSAKRFETWMQHVVPYIGPFAGLV
ncbi:MAG: hypothetical protein LBR71_01915 [Synergistaceae bacterium]|jgi:hypothetical protein|nr:hypothetical protein [Synergistaceae bacterium]